MIGPHTETEDDLARSQKRADDQAWSGRAGLTYLFDSGFAPYIAYGTSFVPNVGFFEDTAFKPTTAESKEVGFKYLVPGYNASINSALFDIEQDGGVSSTERGLNALSSVAPCARAASRSRASRRSHNGLSLQASYTYVDMEILDGAR